MDIEYKGGNCVVITTKKATVVTDPKLSALGLKDVTPKHAVVIATQADLLVAGEDAVVIDRPGEYEVRDVSVKGAPAERMLDHDKTTNNTIYRVTLADVTFAVLGHMTHVISEEQLEVLGVVDVLIVPVGGNGYTLDAHQAVHMVRQIDPKVVIPTHYDDKAVNYEVPQMDLEPFIKELAAAQHETTSKWKIKGPLPEILTLLQLERS